MKKQVMILAAVLCVAAALTGCSIHVEYVGQEFPPLPDSHSVMIYKDVKDVPVGEYQIIGKAKLSVAPGIDMVEVREKIAEVAAEHGAAAACIVSIEKRLINTYYGAEPGETAVRRDTISSTARRADGSLVEVNSFGEVLSPNRTYRKRYEHLVRVRLLMPVKDFERAVELRRKAAEKEL